MRISDWSSDVCSSDLGLAQGGLTEFPAEPIPESVPGAGGVPAYPALHDHGDSVSLDVHADRDQARRHHPRGVYRLLVLALVDRMRHARKQLPVAPKTALLYRSEERRVGKACVSTRRSRGPPYHSQNKY